MSLQSAFAEMMVKGKTKVKTLFNLYQQNSKNGKQVFDNSGNEKVSVIEPQIFVKHQITEDTEINASFILDAWTAESDHILDGSTGASGANGGDDDGAITGQARAAPTIGMRKEIGKTSLGVNLGFSSEYDYTSKNISLDVSRLFAEDNFALGLSVQRYAEELKLFNDFSPPKANSISSGHKRDITAINLGASQILTRADIIEFGMTYAKAEGRLESTAGSILLNGTREVEKLPGSRNRKAFFTKWVHAFNEEMSLNTSFRYYSDDWDLTAKTFKVATLFSLNEDQDYLELSLRYHAQDKVKYYKDSFSTNETYMTSDSDMNKFTSYEPSITYSQELGEKNFFGLTIDETTWNNSLTYGKRSTGMSYGYFQTSYAITF
jgi:hypothetical protein